MQETQRLKDLHALIDPLVEENLDADGGVKKNAVLDNLISIYRDIANMDSDAIPKDDRSEISEILHHAYTVNGSFHFEKTGPDTYSVYFMGGFKGDYRKRKCVRFDLLVRNRSAWFKGYEIWLTNNH